MWRSLFMRNAFDVSSIAMFSNRFMSWWIRRGPIVASTWRLVAASVPIPFIPTPIFTENLCSSLWVHHRSIAWRGWAVGTR